jgi:hypothetical protein
MKNRSANTLALAAAFAGPLRGTTARLNAQPNVLRGENSGRLLQRVSVARSMTRVATVRDDGEHSVHVSFPEGPSTGRGSGHHLIIFAQEPHQGAILGATTMFF